MESTGLTKEAPLLCPACGQGIWGDDCPGCGVIPSDFLAEKFWGVNLMSRYDVSATAKNRYTRDWWWERECWRGMVNVLFLALIDLQVRHSREESIPRAWPDDL